jgi:hypothetical protein
MKKPKIIALVLTLTILAAGTGLFKYLNGEVIPDLFYIQDVKTWENGKTGYPLFGGRSIGQTFRANFDGLSRIQVFISSVPEKVANKICFHLKNGPKAGEDLAFIKLRGCMFTEDDGVNIDFNKIYGSKNKYYYFYLEAPGSTVKDRINVYFTLYENPSNSNGSMLLDGHKAKGAVIFNSYFFMKENVSGIAGRLWSQLNMDRRFMAGYFSLICLVIACLIYFLLAKCP